MLSLPCRKPSKANGHRSTRPSTVCRLRGERELARLADDGGSGHSDHDGTRHRRSSWGHGAPRCSARAVGTKTMSDQLLAERIAILADLAAIEAAIAELAEVLATNLGAEVGRKLAETIHINKLAKRGRLTARLASINASLGRLDDADAAVMQIEAHRAARLLPAAAEAEPTLSQNVSTVRNSVGETHATPPAGADDPRR